MTKLCDGCKFQGDCVGEVTADTVVQHSVTRPRGRLYRTLSVVFSADAETNVNFGTYSRISDAEGNMSHVIPTGVKTPEEVVEQIEACQSSRGTVCGAFPNANQAYEASAARAVMSRPQLEKVLANRIIEQVIEG